MTGIPVEAVFFWRYTKAPFAAAYGRLPGSEYSKDFLQSPRDQFPLIDQALGWTAGQIEIEYRWPRGHRQGWWRHSAADERGQLAWPTSTAPAPWRVGDPATDPSITFPGDPTATVDTAANAQFAALEALQLDPWIVALKLRDQDRVLHVRSYLGAPPAGQEARGLDALPRPIRDAIRSLSGNIGAGGLVMGSPLHLKAPELTNKVLASLERDPNALLVGPPGTGKTVVLEDLKSLFLLSNPTVLFDPDKWYGNWSTIEPIAPERQVISLVFHPSYSYEDFVAGLVPSSGENGISLVARPGPLLALAHWAAGSNRRRALLIVDEFNRGPAAAIFGDSLALLDKTKRDSAGHRGATIQRPFPKDRMEVELKFARSDGEHAIADEISLPASIWIVGALNSTDRSVAPLDAALRRRFSIINVPPDYAVLASHFGITTPDFGQTFAPAGGVADPNIWTDPEIRELAVRVLRALNTRIEFVSGSDFALGHALLWDAFGADPESTTQRLAAAFDRKVAATLRLTYVDQDEALAALLKVPPQVTGDAIGRWVTAPPEMVTIASRRLVIDDLSARQKVSALAALHRLL